MMYIKQKVLLFIKQNIFVYYRNLIINNINLELHIIILHHLLILNLYLNVILIEKEELNN